MKFHHKIQLYIWLIKEFVKDLLTPEKFPTHTYTPEEIDKLAKDREVEMEDVEVISLDEFFDIIDDVKKRGGIWIEGYDIEEIPQHFPLTKTMVRYLLRKPLYYCPECVSYLFHRKSGNVWLCMTKDYYRYVRNKLWGQK